MKITSFLTWHAITTAYLTLCLNRIFPDQYPIWFLGGLYLLANLLRWLVQDYNDWANFTLLATTGFVYGFVIGAIFNDWQFYSMLVWGFVSLIALGGSYLIAQFAHEILYDERLPWPITHCLFISSILLASLYVIWPVIINPNVNVYIFLLTLLGSPIILGLATYFLFRAIVNVLARSNLFLTMQGFVIATTLASSLVLALPILTVWWWFDPIQPPSLVRLSQAVVVGLTLIIAIQVWIKFGPTTSHV